MATFEALAAGRPVIATAVCALPELVVDGETGRLVPPRDVKALATAVETLLDDAALRTRIAAAAHCRAHDWLVREDPIASLVRIYGEVLR